MNTAIKFMMRPCFTMVWIASWPVPKTTALGAVATGSIKAQLALIAAGTIKMAGSISAATAAAAKIGISKAVVAVFDVVSVSVVTINAIAMMASNNGMLATFAMRSPT